MSGLCWVRRKIWGHASSRERIVKIVITVIAVVLFLAVVPTWAAETKLTADEVRELRDRIREENETLYERREGEWDEANKVYLRREDFATSAASIAINPRDALCSSYVSGYYSLSIVLQKDMFSSVTDALTVAPHTTLDIERNLIASAILKLFAIKADTFMAYIESGAGTPDCHPPISKSTITCDGNEDFHLDKFKEWGDVFNTLGWPKIGVPLFHAYGRGTLAREVLCGTTVDDPVHMIDDLVHIIDEWYSLVYESR